MKIHKTDEIIKTADEALMLLEEGNRRFISNNLCSKNHYDDQREILNHGQHPFAIVVCCSDSRVAPEIFFDQELGDIFIIRNAGNVVDDTALGSLEYAVEHLLSPLIVVCGHSHCGAVTAALNDDGKSLPHGLQTIIDRIKDAKESGDDLDALIHHNIKYMTDLVKENTIVKKFSTKVMGAYYDINTGEVLWS